MYEVRRILQALRKLNDLEATPPASWVAALSKGERAIFIERAREGIPTAVLGHHDRMVARGRRSLVPVHGGICGACHLRLPTGHRGHLKQFEDLDVCDYCGVFLEWPAAEIETTGRSSGATPAGSPVAASARPLQRKPKPSPSHPPKPGRARKTPSQTA